jgi:DNA-binding PadR family transcriptional regulator
MDSKTTELQALERDLFRGFIPVHVLYHAGKEAVFGQALKQELERHGYRLSFGTLYPILHRLEKGGLLRSTTRNVAGKLRKYYRLTPVGQVLLDKARSYIRELVSEVLEDQ